MNTNYPLTGNVDVVLRAFSQYTLNGRTYEKGEPVAYIKDTEANLTFGGFTKTSTSVKNLTTFTDTFPEEVVIEANVFKDAIIKMFSETISEASVKVSKLAFVTTDDEGKVYLESNVSDLFIYTEDMDKVSSFSLDSASGLVSGLQNETTYYIDYKIIKTDYTGFGFKTMSLPYLTIELKGSVRINGAAKNFLIEIPRAQLNMTPSFNFTRMEFAQTTIRFKIISSKDESGVNMYFY
jgi:hypothetical protein